MSDLEKNPNYADRRKNLIYLVSSRTPQYGPTGPLGAFPTEELAMRAVDVLRGSTNPDGLEVASLPRFETFESFVEANRTEIVRRGALAKLTPEERDVLGI